MMFFLFCSQLEGGHPSPRGLCSDSVWKLVNFPIHSICPEVVLATIFEMLPKSILHFSPALVLGQYPLPRCSYSGSPDSKKRVFNFSIYLFIYLFEAECCTVPGWSAVVQSRFCNLHLLGSSNSLASASLAVAGITGAYHHAWLYF